ncbi:MAG: histidine ammonia-lyase [Bdellovibrionales bacterium]
MELNGNDIRFNDVWKVAYEPSEVSLSKEAKEKVSGSRKYIENRLSTGEAIYGVNTGFGSFSSVRISDVQIEELQFNLIRSHSAGCGDLFTKEQSRAIMLLRANALATGHSGIRVEVIEKILEFLNNDIIPCIPEQGSVGASGDLAPLSHLALAIIGEGEVWGHDGPMPVMELLKEKNIEPLVLKAKEGLSMINGCQVMTAIGMMNVYRARRIAWLLDAAGAITLEAMRGARSAFDPLIPATRKHPGEAKTARNLLKILGESSEISQSHEDCGRVQDAYSLRCMPAVHGAAKDAINRTIETLEIEANSSTDNPLVFPEENKILSCGNFHGEPVAFVLDYLGIAVSAVTSISECRIEKLINPAMSGLPAFLAPEGGLNSGMMIVQVAAASLVSENKILSHPASVDSIPTSADKEDHVSMGTIAARKLGKIVNNAENVLAMELLCACQAIDLLDGLKPAAGALAVYEKIREFVPFAAKDRVFAKDVEKIRELIQDGSLISALESVTGELEC